MILQRQTVVPVWGFDTPDAQVAVTFAGQKKTAVADKYGDWMVELKPLAVSHNERSLTVTNDRNESIVLQGVLVGEVWFSSGQSNMVWIANKSMCSGIARELAKFGKRHPDQRDQHQHGVGSLPAEKRHFGWRMEDTQKRGQFLGTVTVVCVLAP